MKRLFILLLTTLLSSPLVSRSIHRHSNPTIPYITVTASNQEYAELWTKSSRATKVNKLQSRFLRRGTLTRTYKNANFKKYSLPYGYLKFRKGDTSIHTNVLKEEAEIVLKEILQKEKEFTYFTVLKDSGFNYNNLSGFIALKYKNYPFVLKLFIEHPHTFIDPFNKGFHESCQFVLNGNMRHLSGFTRIHNLEAAKKALAKDPEYRYYIDFPRKWYWIPNSQPYLTIDWHDQHHSHHEKIKLPGIYGIICDFIETDKKIQHQEKHTLRQISVDVGNYLHNIIDSNVENFVPEKDSNKIVIIDTEHFPTMVGLDKEMNSNGYIQWYLELTFKYLKTLLMRPKQNRIKDQCDI